MRAHPTLDQLRQLEIFGMAGAFGEASATPRRSAMPTGWGLLLDREVQPSPRRALGRPLALCPVVRARRVCFKLHPSARVECRPSRVRVPRREGHHPIRDVVFKLPAAVGKRPGILLSGGALTRPARNRALRALPQREDRHTDDPNSVITAMAG